jgi:4-amino-4-deoxy-L-arabinose transferase-like glycosyltransferase
VHRSRARFSSGAVAESVGVLAAFLLAAVLLQWLAGAFYSGFGAHPDEAAHFVTALMVRDYIAGGNYANPLAFAENYYLHYPKVAIGHWPPLLYGALGTWLLTFGESRGAALTFVALSAAATAWMIYYTARESLSRAAGLFAASAFVILPLVQQSLVQIMTELPVTMLMLASTLLFARVARTGCSKDGLLFGFVAAAAILTRGSAWALAMVPPLTMLLTRRFTLLARAGLWLSTVPVLVLALPWYMLTRGMSEGAWIGNSAKTPFFVDAIRAFPTTIASSLGTVLLLAAAVGVIVQLLRPWLSRSVDPVWAALAALAMATLMIHCIIPASIEERFMVTVMPPLLLFAAAGVHWVGEILGAASKHGVGRYAVHLALAVVFVLQMFELPVRLQNRGFERLAMEAENHAAPPFWTYLIVSDPRGEGSMVAAVALRDARPRSVVLRGSKILTREDWLGRGATLRFKSPEEVAHVLSRIPVSIVIIDDSILESDRRLYDAQIRAVVSDPSRWRLIGSFSAVRRGRLRESVLHAYVQQFAEPNHAKSAAIDTAMISKLLQRSGR